MEWLPPLTVSGGGPTNRKAAATSRLGAWSAWRKQGLGHWYTHHDLQSQHHATINTHDTDLADRTKFDTVQVAVHLRGRGPLAAVHASRVTAMIAFITIITTAPKKLQLKIWTSIESQSQYIHNTRHFITLQYSWFTRSDGISSFYIGWQVGWLGTISLNCQPRGPTLEYLNTWIFMSDPVLLWSSAMVAISNTGHWLMNNITNKMLLQFQIHFTCHKTSERFRLDFPRIIPISGNHRVKTASPSLSLPCSMRGREASGRWVARSGPGVRGAARALGPAEARAARVYRAGEHVAVQQNQPHSLVMFPLRFARNILTHNKYVALASTRSEIL